MTTFNKWFETFLEEKRLPYAEFEIQSPSSNAVHFISSEVIIEAIKQAPVVEQKGIKDMLVKIDFHNGNVNDYFKHLAGALVKNY